MTKRAPSVASNYDPELFIQFLNDFGRQYANSYRSACNAEHRYQTGKLPPHYPVPTTIGYEITDCAIYVSDTRYHMDGMPLFRGYTWQGWTKGWGE